MKGRTLQGGVMWSVLIAAAMTLVVDEATAAGEASCLPAKDIVPCTCKEKTRGLSIACENSEESQIMLSLGVLKNHSTVIYRLMFRGSNFPKVHDYVFLGLGIQHLKMSKTNISVVEESSLRTLAHTLETLDLSYNNLLTVPSSALEHLQNLSFLNLNYNMIKILGKAAFSGLRALQRLSLYDNSVQHIEAEAFSGTGDKLDRLNLGKNHQEEVPNLQSLSKLQVLTLSENRISRIRVGSFKGLEKLDMLLLENNRVTMLEANVFSELYNLNSLNIKHNDISNVSEHAFAGLEDNLEWLELGHNRLDHIPSHALLPLHNLRQLDLDSNRIVAVPEDAFEGYGESIKYLTLNRNNIKIILPMTFFYLHSLEWLKLSHNDLTHLTEDTVQPILDTLTIIDVSNNPLECDCELMWLRSWLDYFKRRETFNFLMQHTCVGEGRRTVDVLELSTQNLGCPEYIVHPKGLGTSTPVVPAVTIFLALVSTQL